MNTINKHPSPPSKPAIPVSSRPQQPKKPPVTIRPATTSSSLVKPASRPLQNTNNSVKQPLQTGSAVHHSGSVRTSTAVTAAKAGSCFGPQKPTTNAAATTSTTVAFNYNYGVPKTAARQQVPRRAKTGRGSVTPVRHAAAEIYVFARKRPRLACEASYEDVVQVGLEQQQAVICISETKAALDGTPILKKVNRLMISNIDRIALIESMIFRQTNFKLKIYQVHTLIPGKRALGQNLN